MSKENKPSLGSLLKKHRKNAGYSLKELAAKADCSASYLSLLENQKRQPTLKVVQQLTHVLDLNSDDQKTISMAAGFEAAETQLQTSQSFPFLHFLLKIYATAVQKGTSHAERVITEAFHIYADPVYLQILLAFLEATRQQTQTSQQLFKTAKQSHAMQPDAFDKSLFVYAQLLLSLLNDSHLEGNDLETALNTLPETFEKSCLAIFVHARQNDQTLILAQVGETLLYSEVPDAFLIIKQAAIEIWLRQIKQLPEYMSLFQKSLTVLRVFASDHPVLRVLTNDLDTHSLA